MATGSFISVTPGAGAKLATGPTYTENANVVQDEKVILGEQYEATYTVSTGSAVSTATAASHLLQITAGASLKVRIRRITIWQFAAATSVAFAWFGLFRLTSAGTGGGALTAAPLDTSDAAAGAAGMTLPTVKGTEGVYIDLASPVMFQTFNASQLPSKLVEWDFDRGHSKPLIIPPGNANGLAIKNINAVAGGAVILTVLFDETSF